MCLICTAHPRLCCTSSLALYILARTAHPRSYCASSLVLHIVYTECETSLLLLWLMNGIFKKYCLGDGIYLNIQLGLDPRKIGPTGSLLKRLITVTTESKNQLLESTLLDGYSSCPAFSQFDWLIIGQDSAILPDGFSWIQTEIACLTKLSQILRKLRKVIKLGKMLLIKLVKMLLIKLVSDYFSENCQ